MRQSWQNKGYVGLATLGHVAALFGARPLVTYVCRYDVGAKEFKPVAAKEVCAMFMPFSTAFDSLIASQVGPTTLAVRLLPQVTTSLPPPHHLSLSAMSTVMRAPQHHFDALPNPFVFDAMAAVLQ